MKEQLICAQTERVTKVSSCGQINMPLSLETEQIDRNNSSLMPSVVSSDCVTPSAKLLPIGVDVLFFKFGSNPGRGQSKVSEKAFDEKLSTEFLC